MNIAVRNSLTMVASTALGCGLAYLIDGSGQSLLGVPLLVALALAAFGAQWVMFVPAYWRQTEKYYDLTGSATYILVVVLAAVSVPVSGARAGLLSLLVVIWALRLGSFLFRRVTRAGKDGRFDEIKTDWSSFLLAWTLQGLWVVLTLMAALAAITAEPAAGLDAWAAAGAAIWAVGFAIEAVADAQKAAFRADPANDGRFIERGLWRWSRHPNYFGEIVLWVGIAVIAAPALQAWQWLAMLSPVFVAALILGVSGVPLLERRAEQRWGNDPDYRRYRESTPVLIPRPPCRGR